MKEPIIIFENNELLVVDKPAGLSVHGDGEDPQGTLVEWFLSRRPPGPASSAERVALGRHLDDHQRQRRADGPQQLSRTSVSVVANKSSVAGRRQQAIAVLRLVRAEGVMDMEVGG
jgi:hypothetical protein